MLVEEEEEEEEEEEMTLMSVRLPAVLEIQLMVEAMEEVITLSMVRFHHSPPAGRSP